MRTLKVFILAHMLEDTFSIDISHIFIVLQCRTARKVAVKNQSIHFCFHTTRVSNILIWDYDCLKYKSNALNTIKPVLNVHSLKDRKLVFKTNYCLMQVKSVA